MSRIINYLPSSLKFWLTVGVTLFTTNVAVSPVYGNPVITRQYPITQIPASTTLYYGGSPVYYQPITQIPASTTLYYGGSPVYYQPNAVPSVITVPCPSGYENSGWYHRHRSVRNVIIINPTVVESQTDTVTIVNPVVIDNTNQDLSRSQVIVNPPSATDPWSK